MSRFTSRLLVPASGLILMCGAYAVSNDSARSEDMRADELRGEIALIELKNGSTVAVEQPRVRTLGGLGFVGGDVVAEAGELPGDRAWVPVGEISRLVEFDSRAKFLARHETERPRAREREGNSKQSVRIVAPRSRGSQRLLEGLENVTKSINEAENPPKKGKD